MRVFALSPNRVPYLLFQRTLVNWYRRVNHALGSTVHRPEPRLASTPSTSGAVPTSESKGPLGPKETRWQSASGLPMPPRSLRRIFQRGHSEIANSNGETQGPRHQTNATRLIRVFAAQAWKTADVAGTSLSPLRLHPARVDREGRGILRP